MVEEFGDAGCDLEGVFGLRRSEMVVAMSAGLMRAVGDGVDDVVPPRDWWYRCIHLPKANMNMHWGH